MTTPQETLKIKLIHDQLVSEKPKYNGFFHGVKTIVKQDGLAATYKGLVPTILKVSTAQATRFGVFNFIPEESREGPVRSALAGAGAGFVSVVLFHYIDVIKSRMQGLHASKYKNAFDCGVQIVRQEGVTALYKGVTPRLARVCAEVAITMTLYTEVVKFLNKIWKTE